mmetsp:Transcript_12959/g.52162  ORF Transcript_12959/g.52162 Transcript_12959/m.52162 type:complete len:219 (-) Transcript_12959:2674-3330(-)
MPPLGCAAGDSAAFSLAALPPLSVLRCAASWASCASWARAAASCCALAAASRLARSAAKSYLKSSGTDVKLSARGEASETGSGSTVVTGRIPSFLEGTSAPPSFSSSQLPASDPSPAAYDARTAGVRPGGAPTRVPGGSPAEEALGPIGENTPPASMDAAIAPSPPLGAAAASAPPMDLTPLAGAGVSPPHPSWGRHSVPGHSSSSSSRAGRPGVLPG